MLPEVRMARIVEAIGRVRSNSPSCVEAADWLGISERHFRRLRDAYWTRSRKSRHTLSRTGLESQSLQIISQKQHGMAERESASNGSNKFQNSLITSANSICC